MSQTHECEVVKECKFCLLNEKWFDRCAVECWSGSGDTRDGCRRGGRLSPSSDYSATCKNISTLVSLEISDETVFKVEVHCVHA